MTSFVAIALGITVIVAVRTMSTFSEKAVAGELDNLGANVLILPKGATVSNYYSADFGEYVMPESYVDDITTSGLQGVDNLSPKLTEAISLQGKPVYLTGILPKEEFKSKPAWQSAGGIFERPAGCGTVVPGAIAKALGGNAQGAGKTDAVRKAVVEELGPAEVLVGQDVASRFNLKVGATLPIKGESFTVKSVLPSTGTVDDTRVFAHLHTVQRLFGRGHVVNAIEMIGCCKEISKGLTDGLNRLLPEAKVVTIKQIAQTQLKTNTMMERFSVIFLVIILLVGAVSIANYMLANVYERRKEIGTLLALGATPATHLQPLLHQIGAAWNRGRRRGIPAGHGPGRCARTARSRRPRASLARLGGLGRVARGRGFRARERAAGEQSRPARPGRDSAGRIAACYTQRTSRNSTGAARATCSPWTRSACRWRPASLLASWARAGAARAPCC